MRCEWCNNFKIYRFLYHQLSHSVPYLHDNNSHQYSSWWMAKPVKEWSSLPTSATHQHTQMFTIIFIRNVKWALSKTSFNLRWEFTNFLERGFSQSSVSVICKKTFALEIMKVSRNCQSSFRLLKPSFARANLSVAQSAESSLWVTILRNCIHYSNGIFSVCL